MIQGVRTEEGNGASDGLVDDSILKVNGISSVRLRCLVGVKRRAAIKGRDQ